MPPFGPMSRNDLIYFLRKSDFQGPYSGGKHQFMIKGELKVRIPNPHKKDIGRNLLWEILKQAKISKTEWEGL